MIVGVLFPFFSFPFLHIDTDLMSLIEILIKDPFELILIFL